VNGHSLAVLARILRKMKPVPEQALVIGSFGLALIERRLGAITPLIRTQDIDIALDGSSGHVGPQAWLDGLEKCLDGVYRAETRGAAHGGSEFHVFTPNREGLPRIELLLRLGGGGRRPPESRGRFRPMQPRNLGLLFLSPWLCAVDDRTEVRAPNPLSFVLQKAVIRRRGPDGEKDAAGVLRLAEVAAARPEAIRGLQREVEGDGRGAHRRAKDALRAFEEDYLADDARCLDRAIRALGKDLTAPNRVAARSALRAFMERCAEDAS